MREKEFKAFLSSKYLGRGGKPLSSKVVADILSRCRRMERCLKMELEVVIEKRFLDTGPLKPMVKSSSLRFGGDPMVAKTSMRYAVGLYKKYLECNSRQ
jgi:hypothetical protein